MSKGAKIGIIIAAILVFLLIAGVAGFGFLIYRVANSAKIQENETKGAEFGRTTDNFGCQENVVSSIKDMGTLDIAGSLNATAFYKSCLRTSRVNKNFCDNVPGELSDKLNGDEWKDAECERAGIQSPHVPCRTVMKVRTEHCQFSH